MRCNQSALRKVRMPSSGGRASSGSQLDDGEHRPRVALGQNHPGGLYGHVGSGPDRDADAGPGEGGGVGYAVAVFLQRGDDAELVLGVDPRVDRTLAYRPFERLVAELLELRASDRPVVFGDVQLPCYGSRRLGVIAP